MYLAEYARLVTGVCNEFNQDSVSGKAKAPVDVSSMCSSGYLHAMEMRRGNEVGNTVMPSLEAAGNNIFQYFLVSAIANARLSRKCTLGEVLEYLQYNVIFVFLKTSSSQDWSLQPCHLLIQHISAKDNKISISICCTMKGKPCIWKWLGWWPLARRGSRHTLGGTGSDTEKWKIKQLSYCFTDLKPWDQMQDKYFFRLTYHSSIFLETVVYWRSAWYSVRTLQETQTQW